MYKRDICKILLFLSVLVVLKDKILAKSIQLKNCTHNYCDSVAHNYLQHIDRCKKYGYIKFTKLVSLNRKGNGHNKRVIHFYKNKTINKKMFVQARKGNGIFLQNSQKEVDGMTNNDDYNLDGLNEKQEKNSLLKIWKNLQLNDRFRFLKCFFIGSVCILSFSYMYNFLLNKKMETIIYNILKEKFLFMNLSKRSYRKLCFLSYSEFRSSPFFLSAIVIASYTFYIFLKVYFEKYKEAKRIKEAIQDYNRKKQEYINTGTNADKENEKEGDINIDSSGINDTDNLYSFNSFYESDQSNNEKNIF